MINYNKLHLIMIEYSTINYDVHKDGRRKIVRAHTWLHCHTLHYVLTLPTEFSVNKMIILPSYFSALFIREFIRFKYHTFLASFLAGPRFKTSYN